MLICGWWDSKCVHFLIKHILYFFLQWLCHAFRSRTVFRMTVLCSDFHVWSQCAQFITWHIEPEEPTKLQGTVSWTTLYKPKGMEGSSDSWVPNCGPAWTCRCFFRFRQRTKLPPKESPFSQQTNVRSSTCHSSHRREQPKCPLMDGKPKWVCPHNGVLSSQKQEWGADVCYDAGGGPEDVMPSEEGQTRTATCCMISFTWNI